MRSGLIVPGDDISDTWGVPWRLVGAGVLLVLVLEVDLVPLADFDLLDILGLLKGLLVALAAGLGALVPLVTAAIDGGLKKCIGSEGEEIE